MVRGNPGPSGLYQWFRADFVKFTHSLEWGHGLGYASVWAQLRIVI